MSYIPSGIGEVFIVDSDDNRHKIRVHTRAAHTPSEAPTETRRSLDRNEGERSSVGSPGFGQFAFDFEPNPFLDSNKRLRALHRSGGLVSVEMDYGAVPDILQSGSDGVREVALAATGVLTASGSAAPAFGTEAAPAAPWTQGLGIILNGALYIIDEVLSPATLKVSRWGAVAADPRASATFGKVPDGRRIANADDVTLAVVNATHQYQLVQMGVRARQPGRISLAGGSEASGAGETSSAGNIVLQSAEVLTALLPAA